MNTILEPAVENGAARPASSAFSLHRCNRLSNVLAALKLRQTDAALPTAPVATKGADVASEVRHGRPVAPHYLTLR